MGEEILLLRGEDALLLSGRRTLFLSGGGVGQGRWYAMGKIYRFVVGEENIS